MELVLQMCHSYSENICQSIEEDAWLVVSLIGNKVSDVVAVYITKCRVLMNRVVGGSNSTGVICMQY